MAFASSTLLLPYPISMPYGLPASDEREYGVPVFCVIDHYGQLRRSLDAGGATIPCRQLGDLQPDHTPLTQRSGLRPRNPGRSVLYDGAYDSLPVLALLPLTLALNPAGFGKGSFRLTASDPIRYIVGRASHPVISANSSMPA